MTRTQNTALKAALKPVELRAYRIMRALKYVAKEKGYAVTQTDDAFDRLGKLCFVVASSPEMADSDKYNTTSFRNFWRAPSAQPGWDSLVRQGLVTR